MRCANCEREFDEAAGDCPYCGAVPEQHIKKTRQEAGAGTDAYNGGQDGARYNNARVHVRQINFSSGFLSQLFWVALILLGVFVFLPAFILIVLGLAVVWFVLRLFRSF